MTEFVANGAGYCVKCDKHVPMMFKLGYRICPKGHKELD